MEAIQKAAEEDDNPDSVTYKVFDFPEACRVLSGSIAVYGRKVDHVYDLTMSVIDLVENNSGDNATGNAGTRKGAGRKKAQNLGSTSYELIDMKLIKEEALQQLEKVEKEDKKAIDNLRLVDNAEINEAQYERKSLLVIKPTQFMFKLNYGQLSRTDEQIQNARPRPEVIGKVKDFDIKKSDINHEHQMLYTHDDYRRNCDQFTIPGARWIPDNKELAANFGVAEIEVELDLDQEAEKINAYGPFKVRMIDVFLELIFLGSSVWKRSRRSTPLVHRGRGSPSAAGDSIPCHLSCCNHPDLERISRFWFATHPDVTAVRGTQSQQFESICLVR